MPIRSFGSARSSTASSPGNGSNGASASRATTRSSPAPSTGSPCGRPVPLPRADAWAQLVSDELARFQASTA